ncbi:hypothetical protein FRX31_010001, partial [Thalictrum thalictroides]
MYKVLAKDRCDYPSSLVPFPYKLVWEVKVPSFVKFFMWSLVWNRILTVDQLAAKGIIVPNSCVMCANTPEDTHHLFLSCPVSLQVWRALIGHINRFNQSLNHDSIKEVLLNWADLNNRGLAVM